MRLRNDDMTTRLFRVKRDKERVQGLIELSGRIIETLTSRCAGSPGAFLIAISDRPATAAATAPKLSKFRQCVMTHSRLSSP